MSARLLVLGDVHGAARALEQVLERASFDPTRDRLVFLGDVCDGWPDVAECAAILTRARAECVWGNHDLWAEEWLLTGRTPHYWTMQGGQATLDAFGGEVGRARRVLGPLFAGMRDFIHDAERDFLFVHGGIPMDRTVHTLPGQHYLTWDRDLFETAAALRVVGGPIKPLTNFRKVFIGHTSTQRFSDTPIEVGGVVMMDQGAGWDGYLSLMDADTGEFWQSDRVPDLYPDVKGRAA